MNQEIQSAFSAFNEDPKLKRELLAPLIKAERALITLKAKDKMVINTTTNSLIKQNPLKYLSIIKNTGGSGAVIRLNIDALSHDIRKELGDTVIPKSILEKGEDFKLSIQDPAQYLEAYNNAVERKIEHLLETEKQLEELSELRISIWSYTKKLFDTLVNTNTEGMVQKRGIRINIINFKLKNKEEDTFNYRYENGILKQIYRVEESLSKKGETSIQNIPITEGQQNEWIEANVTLERFKKDNLRIVSAISVIHIEKLERKIQLLKATLSHPLLKEQYIRDAIANKYEELQFSEYDVIDYEFEFLLRDNLIANSIIDNEDILTAQFGVTPDTLLKLSNNADYKKLQKRKKKITYIIDNKEKFNSEYDNYEDSFEEGGTLAPIPGWFINAYSVDKTGKYFHEFKGLLDAHHKMLIQTGATEEYDALHDQGVTPGFQKLLDTKDINSVMPQKLSYAPSINLSDDLAILNQKERNQIIGQANFEAMSVLIHNAHQRQDTLPHEYAHHYVRWFKDTAIVQEGIKRFGSEFISFVSNNF